MKYDYHEEYNLRFQEGIINLILLKINREDLNKQIVLYKNEICRKCNAIKIITICLLGTLVGTKFLKLVIGCNYNFAGV